VEDFDREIYGRVPPNAPRVNWELITTAKENISGTPAIIKRLIGHVDNSSYPPLPVHIELKLTVPADTTAPVPVMMELGPSSEVLAAFAKRHPDLMASQGPTWPQQVLAKGWGFAVYIPTSRSGRQRQWPDRRHHRICQQRTATQTG